MKDLQTSITLLNFSVDIQSMKGRITNSAATGEIIGRKTVINISVSSLYALMPISSKITNR